MSTTVIEFQYNRYRPLSVLINKLSHSYLSLKLYSYPHLYNQRLQFHSSNLSNPRKNPQLQQMIESNHDRVFDYAKLGKSELKVQKERCGVAVVAWIPISIDLLIAYGLPYSVDCGCPRLRVCGSCACFFSQYCLSSLVSGLGDNRLNALTSRHCKHRRRDNCAAHIANLATEPVMRT